MNTYFDEKNGFTTLKPCEPHGRYYCDDRVCVAVRATQNYISGADPGDDQDFIDKHKRKWPKYQPQWKNKGMA